MEVMIAHGTRIALVPRPLEQNDMPRSTVKRISRCSENRNLTDTLEQQGVILGLSHHVEILQENHVFT
jgi:hypothetical protein